MSLSASSRVAKTEEGREEAPSLSALLFSPEKSPAEPFQILRPDGSLDPDTEDFVDLGPEQLLELHRLMVVARILDEESMNLQRQGELGVYTPVRGQEAAQVGSAYALEDGDWVFPYGREHAVALTRGIDMADVLHLFRGTWHGGLWDFRAFGMAPYCIPVATQVPHAVGFALGAKLDGASLAVVAYFGDGAVSKGDFHEAANMAGVWSVPVVLFCQNNQYAISLPLAKQTAAASLAGKATGYGFPGVRVDGNDVLAVHAATREALARAREGKGPTLIEAVTYRLGPHSTADDPSRYRSSSETDRWERLDPIPRFTTFLEGRALLTKDLRESHVADGKQKAVRLREAIVGAPAGPDVRIFDDVYGRRTPTLEAQRASFLSFPPEA